MHLLSGADISIRMDQETGLYTAHVSVGYTHQEATASDPVRALGLAIMLQAEYTEGSLKNKLSYLNDRTNLDG